MQKARFPENVRELQAFLGLLKYYGRFLYSLSTVLAPLHKLLCKEQKWFWRSPQQWSFSYQRKCWRTMIRLSQYSCNAMHRTTDLAQCSRTSRKMSRGICIFSSSYFPSNQIYLHHFRKISLFCEIVSNIYNVVTNLFVPQSHC